ncbi:MAG TPA: 16S rRNA (cytosine(1402)-N(4))-methyltransferase RsmH [Rectinemataceae bacterium]|nr:16S rRNA (cytosine(1402)-N(4))-methyltransferase RsmH [Rectinemataceae bacterium]
MKKKPARAKTARKIQEQPIRETLSQVLPSRSETESPVILHRPVMLAEILELFEALGRPDALVADCTLGAGGHAEAMLSRFPGIRYVGIDADPEARDRSAARLRPFADRLEIRAGYFDDVLEAWASFPGFERPDFILFDLGVSTHHYLDSNRGFSFANEEPLDMRFSPDAETSAYDLVNAMKENDLADVIFRYGEERYSRRIAKAILEARRNAPIRTSKALASIVAGAVPSAYRYGRIHPATRTFQALRISVNSELEREEKGLALAARMLAPGGILAVISFHSLEDRIAKQLCKDCGRNRGYEEIYKKPRVPTDTECGANPASRSAKLRALRSPAEAASGGAEAEGART